MQNNQETYVYCIILITMRPSFCGLITHLFCRWVFWVVCYSYVRILVLWVFRQPAVVRKLPRIVASADVWQTGWQCRWTYQTICGEIFLVIPSHCITQYPQNDCVNDFVNWYSLQLLDKSFISFSHLLRPLYLKY